jgi:hypothetical protein
MADWPPMQVAARVAEIIRDHPESHDQGVWLETTRATTGAMLAELDGVGECDTEACVAGWVAILVTDPYTTPGEKESGFIHKMILPDGKPAEIRSIAQQALDLNDIEAGYLFDADRARVEVIAFLDELAAGHRPELPIAFLDELAAGHRPELPDDDEDDEDA